MTATAGSQRIPTGGCTSRLLARPARSRPARRRRRRPAVAGRAPHPGLTWAADQRFPRGVGLVEMPRSHARRPSVGIGDRQAPPDGRDRPSRSHGRPPARPSPRWSGTTEWRSPGRARRPRLVSPPHQAARTRPLRQDLATSLATLPAARSSSRCRASPASGPRPARPSRALAADRQGAHHRAGCRWTVFLRTGRHRTRWPRAGRFRTMLRRAGRRRAAGR
jgi:hypothetical protein